MGLPSFSFPSAHTFLGQHSNGQNATSIVFTVIGANGVIARTVSLNKWFNPFALSLSVSPSEHFCVQYWHMFWIWMSLRNLQYTIVFTTHYRWKTQRRCRRVAEVHRRLTHDERVRMFGAQMTTHFRFRSLYDNFCWARNKVRTDQRVGKTEESNCIEAVLLPLVQWSEEMRK